MTPEAWIALAALVVTILLASGGVVWIFSSKISTVDDDFDVRLSLFRETTNVEHRDIRKEFNDALAKAYLEMGEAPKALREKVNQVELFMRDEYLPKRDYERDQDRLLETIRSLGESINRRLDKFEEKLDAQREPT